MVLSPIHLLQFSGSMCNGNEKVKAKKTSYIYEYRSMFICVVTFVRALNIGFACAIEKNENKTLNIKQKRTVQYFFCLFRRVTSVWYCMLHRLFVQNALLLTAMLLLFFLSFFMLPQRRNDHIYLTRCFQMKRLGIFCMYLHMKFKAFYFSFPSHTHTYSFYE